MTRHTHIHHLPFDLRLRLETVELVAVHTPLLGERFVIERVIETTNEVLVAITAVLVLGPRRRRAEPHRGQDHEDRQRA